MPAELPVRHKGPTAGTALGAPEEVDYSHTV